MDLLIEYFKSKNVKVQMEEEIKIGKPDLGIPEDEDSEEDGDFEA